MNATPAGGRQHPNDALTEEQVLRALHDVADPCCRDRGISIVDLGLVEGVRVGTERLEVDLVLTTGWCPFFVHLLGTAEERLRQVAGTGEVRVNVVWDPPWTPDRISDSARRALSLPLEELVPRPYGRHPDGPAEEARDAR